MLKYLAANMGLIHTKINDILKDALLIRHQEYTASGKHQFVVAYIGLATLAVKIPWYCTRLE
ncbi:MAG: hypothetical protein WA364_19635 [Candidatus Nitrosopolaris sp.]